jgi:hypothetical protein
VAYVLKIFSDDFNEGLVLPTLIRQLRGILDQYPDDGQILKVSSREFSACEIDLAANCRTLIR